MRRFVLVGALGLSACLRPVAYACEDDQQCVRPGVDAGTCEPQGYCSFPDDTCATGKRFSDLAASSLAGECVSGEESTGAIETTSTSSTTIDPITLTGSTSTTATTTVSPTSDSTTGESSTTEAITSGPTSSSSSSSSSTGCEPTMPEPVGWWPLDGNAQDFGTAGVDGDVQGNPVWVEGHIGDALDLDGTGDRVFIDEMPAFDLADFTLAAWVNVHAPATVGHPSIVGKGQNYRLRLESTTTRVGAVFSDPDANEVNEQGSITCGAEGMLPMDEWHHVAATYSLADRTLRVFVDGEVSCEITSTGGDGVPTVENTSVHLGYWSGNSGAYFNGIIDDARIYDVALCESEVAALAAM